MQDRQVKNTEVLFLLFYRILPSCSRHADGVERKLKTTAFAFGPNRNISGVMGWLGVERKLKTTAFAFGPNRNIVTSPWGDGLAQWLERWTGDPKFEVSNPVMRSTRKNFWSFSESKRLC